MATFMDALAANPGGTGSIASVTSPASQPDPMSLLNQVKDRELSDFQKKAQFMSDLQVRQERQRRLFDIADQQQYGSGPDGQGQPNTVMAQDPNQMTGAQKADIALRQQALQQDQAKTAQAGKLGQERLDIQTAQEKLNQQKSDQINELKTQDLQRKIDDANNRYQTAMARLQQTKDNAAAQLAAHKELADAVGARHQAEMAMKQHQFDVTSKQHQQQIDDLQKKVGAQSSSRQRTTVETNKEGTARTTTVEKGTAADSVVMYGPDGSPHYIPADKVDDARQNYQMTDQPPSDQSVGQ